jgi:hypothetical protein
MITTNKVLIQNPSNAKFTLLLLLFITTNFITMAQTPNIVGEYYFRRQEMVAAFKFSVTGKFDFFHSYGAIDRNASGTFTIDGDTLKLKSDKEGGADFTVLEQSKTGNGYIISCNHPNKMLMAYIACTVFIGTEKQEFEANNDGEIHIELEHCDKIYVKNRLFPDVPTLIKDENNENNRFSLSMLPSLEQVSFKWIDFKIVDDHKITCFTNYFMQVSDIEFIKD